MKYAFYSVFFTLISFNCLADPTLNKSVSESVGNENEAQNAHLIGITRLEGDAVDDSLNQSRAFGFGVFWDFWDSFSPELGAHVQALTLLQTGTSEQTIYSNDEYRPRSKAELDEAILEVTPGLNLDFRLGAGNQTYFDMPLFFATNVAFPGATEQWSILPRNDATLNLVFTAQEALASDAWLTSQPEPGEQSAPVYTYGSVQLESHPASGIKISGRVGYFKFGQLSAAMAQMGRQDGNSVVGLGGSAARFLYDYSGYDSGLKLSFDLSSRWNLSLLTEWAINNSGPVGANQGYSYHLTPTYRLTPGFKIRAQFLKFRNESDLAPAVFTAKELGHSNRDGYGAGAGFEMEKQGISLDMIWNSANPIGPNPYQTPFQYIQLLFRKNYTIL